MKNQTRLSDFTFTFHFHALEKEMATHSSVLAWRIPGTGEPCWLPSMGLHRVRHDWSDLAAAAALAKIQSRVPCGNWELKWSCVPREKINLFNGHMAFSQLQCATHLLNPYNNPLNGFNIPPFFSRWGNRDSEKWNDLLKMPKSWEGGDLNSINLVA